MLRLQNSNEDVVDRAVIANLFVSYFKKNRFVFAPIFFCARIDVKSDVTSSSGQKKYLI